jgi:hypothetical protein
MEQLDSDAIKQLRDFFNVKHEIILCSVSRDGVPNAALMGSCRLSESGNVEFEVSEPANSPAMTFANIKENKNVLFMRFVSGERARDYKGLRIYAEITELQTSGEKIDALRAKIAEKYGADKAAETRATVTCRITNIRPILDRRQGWRKSI